MAAGIITTSLLTLKALRKILAQLMKPFKLQKNSAKFFEGIRHVELVEILLKNSMTCNWQQLIQTDCVVMVVAS